MSDFDTFWSIFPRHVDKALARAKFEAIIGPDGLWTRMRDRESGETVAAHFKATAVDLVRAARLYAHRCGVEETEQRYICHPATWLNRGRWMDYTEAELAEFETREERYQAAVIRMQGRRK